MEIQTLKTIQVVYVSLKNVWETILQNEFIYGLTQSFGDIEIIYKMLS